MIVEGLFINFQKFGKSQKDGIIFVLESQLNMKEKML